MIFELDDSFYFLFVTIIQLTILGILIRGVYLMTKSEKGLENKSTYISPIMKSAKKSFFQLFYYVFSLAVLASIDFMLER